MRIGDYQINPVEFGRFKLDGGAMFGVVPKPLWERNAPADDKNRISMATRGMLIRADQRRILVDTGIGDKLSEKLMKIYGVDHKRYSMMDSLAAMSVKDSDITDVILTHLHFDHTGGSTKLDETGKLVPTFPEATYWVQKKHLSWALQPSERDKASFLSENFVPLQEHGCLKLLEGETEIFPRITVIPIDGHTFAQQMIKVGEGRESLLYCADLIPTAAHIPYPFIMGYDLQPLVTLEEKKRILGQAGRENWLFFFEHDPRVITARIEQNPKGYQLGEEVEVIND